MRDGEIRPRDIGTEVILMPAALSAEKAATMTNPHRLLQWPTKWSAGRATAAPRPGSCFVAAVGRSSSKPAVRTPRMPGLEH